MPIAVFSPSARPLALVESAVEFAADFGGLLRFLGDVKCKLECFRVKALRFTFHPEIEISRRDLPSITLKEPQFIRQKLQHVLGLFDLRQMVFVFNVCIGKTKIIFSSIILTVWRADLKLFRKLGLCCLC